MNRPVVACATALAAALPAVAVTAVVAVAGLAAGAEATAPCGPGDPGRVAAGSALDSEQLANAQTIITTTARRGLPSRAAVVAVATALQESSLRNLSYGDLDSLGLFQQRASWGPASTRLDPVATTSLFLDALSKVPAWADLPVTVASDRVQRSAYPWAVAKWVTTADRLVAGYWPPTAQPSGRLAGTPGGAMPTPTGTNMPTLTGTTSAPGCAGQGGDGSTLTGRTQVPTGYAPPAGEAQAAVVRFALAQLGKPYVWGGTGPDGWDCSGLTMRAWAAAGVTIPRTSYQQVLTGVPVPSTAQLRPGDLIFTAGADGTPAAPGHMGLFLGPVDGTPTLIHAPRTGSNVQLQALSAWAGTVVAIRRPLPDTQQTTGQPMATHGTLGR